MSKYLMVFDGSHDLAWIENAIQGEEALAIAKAAGSVIAEALAERAIGRVLAAGSPPQLDEADVHLTKSASLLEEIGAKFDLARTFLAQGRIRSERKDWNGAATSLQRAVTLAKECGLQREETMARNLLASSPLVASPLH